MLSFRDHICLFGSISASEVDHDRHRLGASVALYRMRGAGGRLSWWAGWGSEPALWTLPLAGPQQSRRGCLPRYMYGFQL